MPQAATAKKKAPEKPQPRVLPGPESLAAETAAATQKPKITRKRRFVRGKGGTITVSVKVDEGRTGRLSAAGLIDPKAMSALFGAYLDEEEVFGDFVDSYLETFEADVQAAKEEHERLREKLTPAQQEQLKGMF